jgi:hypothetical protein
MLGGHRRKRFPSSNFGRRIIRIGVDYNFIQRIINGDDHGAWNVVTLRGLRFVQV